MIARTRRWESEPTTLVAVGKTKEIPVFDNFPSLCIVRSLDAATGGDGARRSVIKGKGELSNTTACRIFEYLRRHGVSVAYYEQYDRRSFFAPLCRMVPLEMVGRLGVGEKGSYLARHPEVQPNTRFESPVVEGFLKTTGREWKGEQLICDDPLLVPTKGSRGSTRAFSAVHPKTVEVVLKRVTLAELGITVAQWEFMYHTTGWVGSLLSDAWDSLGCRLDDFKIEFGFAPDGSLMVADVIDNDSHRLWSHMRQQDVSKQGFRDGEPESVTAEKYRLVANLAEQFPL